MAGSALLLAWALHPTQRDGGGARSAGGLLAEHPVLARPLSGAATQPVAFSPGPRLCSGADSPSSPCMRQWIWTSCV